MDTKYKSFVRNYLLNTSLFDFVLAYAFYNLLFSLRGLSVFEISILLTWWALSALVLEVPSGALADNWSRKKLMVLAPLIKAVCFIIWFFANGNIYLYGLGFLCWSIGSTFMSGTAEAVLYDELKVMKMEDRFEKVLSLKKFFFYLALAVSILSGGLIAQYDINLALILSIFPLGISAFFASQIPETKIIKTTGEINYFSHIKDATSELKNNKTLLYLSIYLFGVSIMGQIEEFDQLYYQFVNLPIYAFGIVGFFWSIVNAIGSYYAYKIKSHKVFYLLPLITGLLLLLVGHFPSINAILLLMLGYLFASPLKILIDSRIQHSIKSQSRATVTSSTSFLVDLFAILVTPIFGYINNIWDINSIYTLAGFIIIILSFWAFFNRRSFAQVQESKINNL